MIYDICVNLQHHSFKDDYSEVIKRGREGGIEPLLCTTDLKSLLFHQKRAKDHNTFYTSGCHPHHANFFNDEKRQLKEALKDEKCLFVGELGLDFNRNFSSPEIQKEAFKEQLEWHKEFKKPLLLHDREASEVCLKILDSYDIKFKGVLHCATSSSDITEEYLKRDFYIGYTPWIMDPRRGGEALESMIKTPLNRLLIETDAPFLPVWENGKKKYMRSEPIHLNEFIPFIARARKIKIDELKNQLKENFENLTK